MRPMIGDPFSGSDYDYMRAHRPVVDIFTAGADGRHLRILAARTETEYGLVMLVGLHEEGRWLYGQANDGIEHPIVGIRLVATDDGYRGRFELGCVVGVIYNFVSDTKAEVKPRRVTLWRRRMMGESWKREVWTPSSDEVWHVVPN